MSRWTSAKLTTVLMFTTLLMSPAPTAAQEKCATMPGGIGLGGTTRATGETPTSHMTRITSLRIAKSLSSELWPVQLLIRWTNPENASIVVHMTGDLVLVWHGRHGTGSPVDVDLVIAHHNVSRQTTTPLFSETVSKPTPRDTNFEEVKLSVNVYARLESGDSIIITQRARNAVDEGFKVRTVSLVDSGLVIRACTR